MALAIDASSPAIATQTNGTIATLTTASFTPPAGSLLLILWDCDALTNPSTPTITDSLGTPLTYTLSDWQSKADSPTVFGQAAAWTAPVGSSTAMTVTVTSGSVSGERVAALSVIVLTGQDTVTPVGAHGKSGSASAASIAQSYTAQSTGGWGFIADCDFDQKGAQTAGTGCTLIGSANASTAITYGFVRRTTADDSNGASNTLNVTLPATSTNLNWVYVEVNPAAGAAAAESPAGQYAFRPPGLLSPAGQLWAFVSTDFTPSTPESTTGPLVVGPPSVWPLTQPALVFAAPAQPVGVQPLLVTPPQAWPQVPAPLITASQPLGNPAVGTPGPLVVSTPWKAPVPGAAITSNPAAPVVSTATTPGPLVVTPPYVPAPVPAVTVTASQPLGNPAVPSPGPLVVGPPYTQVPVPGARMSGNPAAPVGSTGATPGPLVAGPATTPVLIPRTVLSSSFPLGNPATATPPPLVVGPPFTLAPVPGAKVFAAPAAPTVPAVGTPGPLVVTPPFRPVPIPRTYFSASFPLGNPATPTPQPLLVSPAHRWAQLTPATMFTAAGCACTVTRPATGTVTRPSAGTVAYGGATVVRPSTGVVTRPNTGIVEDPCC